MNILIELLSMIDLTEVIETIIGLMVMLAMRYIIPWIRAKLTDEQEAGLATIIEIAVMAAEKIYGAKQGDTKLAYVQEYLAARGIHVDTMRLKAYVNAAIKKMELLEAPVIEVTPGENEDAQEA